MRGTGSESNAMTKGSILIRGIPLHKRSFKDLPVDVLLDALSTILTVVLNELGLWTTFHGMIYFCFDIIDSCNWGFMLDNFWIKPRSICLLKDFNMANFSSGRVSNDLVILL